MVVTTPTSESDSNKCSIKEGSYYIKICKLQTALRFGKFYMIFPTNFKDFVIQALHKYV